MPNTDEMRRQYTAYLIKECNLSPLTSYSYQSCLKRLEDFVGKSITEVDVPDVRRFLRDSEYGPQAKNGAVVALKSFHRWGALEGYWSLNGIVALRGPKLVRNPNPSLEREEARTLLQSCKRPADFRVIYLGLYAGTRVSETASIGAGEWKGDKLRFVGKGRKVREVPVHPKLAERRDVILSKQPSVGSLKQTCRVFSYVSQIPWTSHTLRRSFACALIEARVNRDIIGALLGHAGSITTAAYAPVAWWEKTEAIARLSY
jgi:site-specific recombinase XerD